MNSDPLETRTGTNYKLCWVCQDQDQKDLKDPQRSLKPGHATSTYETAQTNVKYFLNNGISLPYGLKEEHINDGSGIAANLAENKAVHHDKCRKSLLKEKADRELNKRKQEEPQEPEPSPKKLRSNVNTSYSRETPVCVK